MNISSLQHNTRDAISRSSEGSETVLREAPAVISEARRTDQRMPNLALNSSDLSVVSEALDKRTLNEPTHPGLPGSQEVALTSNSDVVICSGSRDFRFALYNGEAFKVHHLLAPTKPQQLPAPEKGTIRSMAIGKNHVIVGCGDGSIEKYNFKDKQWQTLFESVFPNPVAGVALGLQDKLLLAGMESGRLYLSHAHKDDKDWVRIRSAGGQIQTVCLSPRADLYAVGRQDGVVEVSRLAEPKHIHMTLEIGKGIERMTFSDDSYLLGVLLDDHSFSIYQLINGKMLINIPLPKNSTVYDVFFSPETNKIIGYLRMKNTLYAVDIQQAEGL